MITIGDFARLGRVSVRMLRHYDSIGLLRPEHVDAHSGYRYYTRQQLRRLNRIVALKDLGLRLDQVASIVDERVSADDLRGMLRLRQAELEDEIREGRHRLARVQARLRLIDVEDEMTDTDVTGVTVKDVPGATLVGLTAVVASAVQEDIGPVVGPLFGEVIGRLGAAGVTPVGPAVGYYTPAPEESDDALRAHVAFPVPDNTAPAGLDRVEVPAARVASVIHRGAMDTVDATYQLLHAWVRDNDLTASGAAREIYLEVPGDSADWVTEVQLDLA